ncbi:MAG: hypothetical protein IPQ07_27710 [Myxococcales bacterium]|nr:hypothetical protein [Myxococcales bacterium]
MKLSQLNLVFSIGLLACGSSNGGGGADAPVGPGTDGAVDAPGSTQRYEPWTAGSVWSYKLTDPSNTLAPQTGQLTTLTGPVDVGGAQAGTQALVAHIDQLVGTKDVYESVSGDLDVRYKTEFYDDLHALTSTETDQPYRLKLDESPAHTVTGAAWSVTFTETATVPGMAPTAKSKTDQWRVVSAAESVTVIAGTYMALHVRRTSSSGSIQDYWYARGVGKVKETGGGQNEELESYTP